MQFLRSKRWRYVGFAAAFVVIAIGGFWLYLIATTSAITYANFAKLKINMTYAEVEGILGGPSTKARPAQELVKRGLKGLEPVIVTEGFQPIPGIDHEYGRAQYEWGSGKLGDLDAKAIQFGRAKSGIREIADVHLWDGPEARIIVSFDDEGRVAGARIIQRVTWRYKVQQWLPWLK